tara:strand:+ start:192 stop:551 length:360 start_codon:yes stop_codon:yes gene_type:complete
MVTRYISKAKFTPDAFRGLLQNPTDREQIAREFGDGVGAEMLDFYFDFSACEAISIWQATSEQMRLLKFQALSSGAFTDIYQSEILTSAELLDLSKSAANVTPLKAPSMDEIDRMLLDE